jgi:hypothetical protein
VPPGWDNELTSLGGGGGSGGGGGRRCWCWRWRGSSSVGSDNVGSNTWVGRQLTRDLLRLPGSHTRLIRGGEGRDRRTQPTNDLRTTNGQRVAVGAGALDGLFVIGAAGRAGASASGEERTEADTVATGALAIARGRVHDVGRGVGAGFDNDVASNQEGRGQELELELSHTGGRSDRAVGPTLGGQVADRHGVVGQQRQVEPLAEDRDLGEAELETRRARDGRGGRARDGRGRGRGAGAGDAPPPTEAGRCSGGGGDGRGERARSGGGGLGRGGDSDERRIGDRDVGANDLYDLALLDGAVLPGDQRRVRVAHEVVAGEAGVGQIGVVATGGQLESAERRLRGDGGRRWQRDREQRAVGKGRVVERPRSRPPTPKVRRREERQVVRLAEAVAAHVDALVAGKRVQRIGKDVLEILHLQRNDLGLGGGNVATCHLEREPLALQALAIQHTLGRAHASGLLAEAIATKVGELGVVGAIRVAGGRVAVEQRAVGECQSCRVDLGGLDRIVDDRNDVLVHEGAPHVRDACATVGEHGRRVVRQAIDERRCHSFGLTATEVLAGPDARIVIVTIDGQTRHFEQNHLCGSGRAGVVGWNHHLFDRVVQVAEQIDIGTLAVSTTQKCYQHNEYCCQAN